MDRVDAKTRSRIMASVKSENTGPEMIVRRLVHKLGFRYRLHDKKLPGHPDLVFKFRKKVVFVHGCFWHRHNCRQGRSVPKVRTDFWKSKFEANKTRDRNNMRKLKKAGWDVLVVWGCETHPSKRDRLSTRLVKFLELNTKCTGSAR